MGLFSRAQAKDCSQENCGHCGDCKWWQGQATGTSDRVSLGVCMHAELVHFNLDVTSDSGCNRFEPAPAMAGAEIESAPVFLPSFA